MPPAPACGCSLEPLGMIIEATNGTLMVRRDLRPSSGRRPVVSHLGRPQRAARRTGEASRLLPGLPPRVGLLWALPEGLQ